MLKLFFAKQDGEDRCNKNIFRMLHVFLSFELQFAEDTCVGIETLRNYTPAKMFGEIEAKTHNIIDFSKARTKYHLDFT